MQAANSVDKPGPCRYISLLESLQAACAMGFRPGAVGACRYKVAAQPGIQPLAISLPYHPAQQA